MTFDPNKFINCVYEQDQFAQLLQFRGKKRILTISGESGYGKTLLMEKFRHYCRTIMQVPVSLVKLDASDIPNSLTLVKKIVSDLSTQNVNFEKFDEAETIRMSGNFAAIQQFTNANKITGILNIQKSQFETGAKDNQFAGIINNYNFSDSSPVTPFSQPQNLTPEQENYAQKVSINAFIKDLENHLKRSSRSAVILLDTYEKSHTDVQQWLQESLFGYFIKKTHPKRLAIVITGQSTPTFNLHWSQSDCDERINSLNGLSRWKKTDINQCIKLFGANDPDNRITDSFHHLIELNIPPVKIVELISIVAVQYGTKNG